METIDPIQLAADMAELSCKLRKPMPRAKTGKSARVFMEKRFTEMIDSSEKSGNAYGFYNGKKLAAYYVRYPSRNFGPLMQSIFIGHAPGDRLAIRELEKLIRSEKKHFDANTFLNLPPNSTEMLSFCLNCGFSVSAVTLSGTRARAEVGLSKMGTPIKLSSLGLTRKRISSLSEVNQSLAIQKREFTKNPQFGRFIGSPEFSEIIRKLLESQLTDKNSSTKTWVLSDKKNKVWGFYSLFIRKKDPLWGPSGGLGIILHEKIQGKGVVKEIYHHLIDVMKKEGILHFLGGTAQPAVMGLAKLMGRKVFATEMAYGKAWFTPEHFGLKK